MFDFFRGEDFDGGIGNGLYVVGETCYIYNFERVESSNK